jgi:hypothetical protein
MKAALEGDFFVPVSISDIKDVETLAALFEVDSNYGRWSEPVGTKREPKRVAPSRHSVRPLKDLHVPSGTKRQKQTVPQRPPHLGAATLTTHERQRSRDRRE